MPGNKKNVPINQHTKKNTLNNGSNSSTVISADMLRRVFGSDISDEVLFEQLKNHRHLYRELISATDIATLAQTVSSLINAWGFCDYTLFRLDTVKRKNAKSVLAPVRVLSSYNSGASLLLNVAAEDVSNQHLAALHYYIASTRMTTLSRPQGLFVLVVSIDETTCYLLPNGTTSNSRYFSITTTTADTSAQELRELREAIEAKKDDLNLLMTTLEGVGVKQFPLLFHPKGELRTAMTVRSLCLLNTLATKDVTLKEAATILCLGSDTVNKHIAKAKEVLGTKTLTGTVWEAVKKGLIDDSYV